LSLEIDYDDGFVAYLNGTEIARRQMGNPGAPVAYNTGALIDHPAGTLENINLTSFINLLRPGENVLAIQAHNKGPNSADFAMIPALRWTSTGSPVPTNTPIATPTTPPTAVVPTATPVNTPTTPSTPLPGGNITARIETDPVTHDNDAANDPAIWIHPTDPALSLIIGTDRKGALEVYDLAGRKLQLIPIATSNVDVRYNFPLGGERVALVTALNKTTGDLAAFKVNPNTRMLEDVVAGQVSMGGGGIALYHSPVSGKYYYFSNVGSTLRQYELFDNGNGKVNAKLVRTVSYGGSGKSEGVVADDVLGQVYVSEETVGIWKLSAEPNGGSAKTLVDKPLAQGGHLQPDVEGLTLYYKNDGNGYLLASSQGNNSYTVYTREGQNQYLSTFKIEDGEVDGASSTGGIDVTNFPLGATFPAGAFVAQDGSNTNNAAKPNQNFKLVPWERIASKLGLSIDTGWDPRQVGAGDMLTLTDTAVNTPDVAPAEVSIPETAIEPPTPTEEPLLEPIPPQEPVVEPTEEPLLEPVPPQEPVVEPIEEPSAVNADVNGDQVVNILDLVFVASHYGTNQPEADVDGNATVDILDLALVARNFDQASPEAPALPVETPAPSLPAETPLPQPTDTQPVEPIPTETLMPQPIPTETPISQPIPTETLPPTATLAPPTPSETSTPTLEPLTPTETLTPTLEVPTPTETPTVTPEAVTAP
jgi:3-phytase